MLAYSPRGKRALINKLFVCQPLTYVLLTREQYMRAIHLSFNYKLTAKHP